jgi:hypothetical protein
VFLRAAIGASGAVTLSSDNSRGVASMSRVSAGRYLITLQDKYSRLMDVSISQVGTATPAAPITAVIAEDVTAAKTISIQFLDAAGAAADPDSGQAVRVHIVLSNVAKS